MAQAGVAQYQMASMQPVRSYGSQRTNGKKNKSISSGQTGSGRRQTGARPASRPAGMKNSPKSGYTGRSTPSGKTFSPAGASNGYSAGKGKAGGESASINGRKPVRPANGKPSHMSSVKSSASIKKYPVKKLPSLQAEKERRRRQMAKIRRRERINSLMLCITGCLVLIALFVYIGRMADIAAASKSINQLAAAVDDLKEEKQFKEYELASARNLDRIKDEALMRLGMIEPSEDQIRYVPINDYLK